MNNLNNTIYENEEVEQTEPWDNDGNVVMSEEEMLADLQQLMDKINNEYSNYSQEKRRSKTMTEKGKEEAVNKIFEILASAGIDGSDQEQVNAFLEELKQKNPEMHELFVDAINGILGESEEMTGDRESEGLPNTSDQFPPEQMIQE